MAWHSDPIDVTALTAGQPFCAGVFVMHRGGIVVTLNADHLPQELAGSAWRVGGVGGGQEPGETVWQCALREAAEEVQAPVDLRSAPVTFLHDADTGAIAARRCVDAVAPILIERFRRPNPDLPFRPGLPTGPYLYNVFFLAAPHTSALRAGDDVQALLTVPPAAWPLLQSTPTVSDMLAAGARLLDGATVDPARRLWLPPNETLTVLIPILQRHPELLSGLEPPRSRA